MEELISAVLLTGISAAEDVVGMPLRLAPSSDSGGGDCLAPAVSVAEAGDRVPDASRPHALTGVVQVLALVVASDCMDSDTNFILWRGKHFFKNI